MSKLLEFPPDSPHAQPSRNACEITEQNSRRSTDYSVRIGFLCEMRSIKRIENQTRAIENFLSGFSQVG
jgi:hypothetical protein